jgi:hypothetical protein
MRDSRTADRGGDRRLTEMDPREVRFAWRKSFPDHYLGDAPPLARRRAGLPLLHSADPDMAETIACDLE